MDQLRVAIVTGAGRGIGKAIALELAQEGIQVVIAELASYGDQAAAELQALTSRAVFLPVNVSDALSVDSMVRQVISAYGRVDILVNNAGVRPTSAFVQMTHEEWDKVLQVNLTGTFNCCKSVMPCMVEQRAGRIINITSIAAQQGSTGGHSHYAAAKAGVIGLTKSLARELAPFQITVNCVAPGWIDTEGWQGSLDGHREEYAARVPLMRLGTAEDVAHAVSFLASDKAAYITGITLPVNGGLFIS